jgi:hypothetical protein
MPAKLLYVERCREGTVGGGDISLHSMLAAKLGRVNIEPSDSERLSCQ